MKKLSRYLAVAAGILAMGITACGKETYELAVVTDVGQLKDGGFNEGTYTGVEEYAKEHNKTYNYYQPANGSDATDNDRIDAMTSAIKAGAKVIVTPGFLQATAIQTVSAASPKTKFVFVDGWAMGLSNVTAISYKEQESGYFAGYGAVKDGYTKLGGTFGGGGSNPACNRFCYGYIDGANAAAKELGKTVEVRVSFNYGSSFSASPELQTQISGWYNAGTEVVFACGGSMVNSVVTAAEATANGKVIGVDTDQSGLSKRVLTSAVKGLAPSVKLVLGEYYNNQWDSKLADKCSNLGAAEDATGLPTADWRFTKFTKEDYQKLFESVKTGKVVPATPSQDDVSGVEFWNAAAKNFANATVIFEK